VSHDQRGRGPPEVPDPEDPVPEPEEPLPEPEDPLPDEPLPEPDEPLPEDPLPEPDEPLPDEPLPVSPDELSDAPLPLLVDFRRAPCFRFFCVPCPVIVSPLLSVVPLVPVVPDPWCVPDPVSLVLEPVLPLPVVPLPVLPLPVVPLPVLPLPVLPLPVLPLPVPEPELPLPCANTWGARFASLACDALGAARASDTTPTAASCRINRRFIEDLLVAPIGTCPRRQSRGSCPQAGVVPGCAPQAAARRFGADPRRDLPPVYGSREALDCRAATRWCHCPSNALDCPCSPLTASKGPTARTDWPSSARGDIAEETT
jgi:hypothetical protein